MDTREAKRRKLSAALTRVPYHTFNVIRQLLQDEEAPPEQLKRESRGYGKKAARAILTPHVKAYKPVSLPGCSGGEVRVHVGALEEIIGIAMQESRAFQEAFFKGPIQTGHCAIDLYADETTGGNVLQAASSKKLHLFHIHIDGVMHALREESWLPLLAIPSRDVKMIRGGFSALVKTVVQKLEEQRTFSSW